LIRLPPVWMSTCYPPSIPANLKFLAILRGASATEQSTPVDPNAPEEPDLTDIPLDAPVADVVDQRVEVAVDDDYRPS